MNQKRCSKCGYLLDLTCFHIDRSRKDGRTSACSKCRTVHTIEYAKENKTWQSESVKKSNKKYMSKSENKQKAASATRRSQLKNPDKFIPYNRARACMKRIKERYPESIECTVNDTLSFYTKAYELEKTTGIKHEVDHIIPLLAGGKHVPSNLCVMTQEEHAVKTNSEYKLIRSLLTSYYKNEKETSINDASHKQ